jgi:hypothetical protein
MDTLTVFCLIDDFCQFFEPHWKRRLLLATPKQRERASGLCLSEVLTIIVGFHLSGYRTFKDYYTRQVLTHQRRDFPGLPQLQPVRRADARGAAPARRLATEPLVNENVKVALPQFR